MDNTCNWDIIESFVDSQENDNVNNLFDFSSAKFIAISSQSLWANYFLKQLSAHINFTGQYDENFNKEYGASLSFLNLLEIIQFSKKEKVILVDFSRIPYERDFNRFFAKKNNIRHLDYTELMTYFDITQMYESPSESKQKTLNHLNEYKGMYELFDDELSKSTFIGYLMARLSGNRKYLYPFFATPDNEYFSLHKDGDGFHLMNNEHFVDVGAYTGDTIYKFLTCCNFSYEGIDAFEPDTKNFYQLRHVKFIDPLNIKLHNKGVGEKNEVINFNHLGLSGFDPNSSIKNHAEIAFVTLDDAVEKMTLLKVDVEGTEDLVINGGKNLIISNKPRIAAACYHHSDNLLKILKSILELDVGYKFKLRHYSSYIGDTCLYAEV